MMNGLKRLMKAKRYKKEVKEIITMQKKAINELETLNKNLKLINQNYWQITTIDVYLIHKIKRGRFKHDKRRAKKLPREL